MAKVTCCGCGLMGSNLVDAFMNAGHDVTIVDLNEQAAQPFVARGAHYTKNLADALDADFILSNLPNDKIVRSVLEALPKGSLKGKIFVNTTSEVPSDVLAMQKLVEEDGGRYIDSCILTYQGEVGPHTGYLLYSGDKAAFEEIQDTLAALSVPVFCSESTAVAAEIVDLVVIAIHYGYVYTLLEGIARCKQYDYPIDLYIQQVSHMLKALAVSSEHHAKALNVGALLQQDEKTVLSTINDAMAAAGIDQRINPQMRKTTNRSVADHYNKMMNIYQSNYEY